VRVSPDQAQARPTLWQTGLDLRGRRGVKRTMPGPDGFCTSVPSSTEPQGWLSHVLLRLVTDKAPVSKALMGIVGITGVLRLWVYRSNRASPDAGYAIMHPLAWVTTGRCVMERCSAFGNV